MEELRSSGKLRRRGNSWSGPATLGRGGPGADHPLLAGYGEEVFLSWFSKETGYVLLPVTTRASSRWAPLDEDEDVLAAFPRVDPFVGERANEVNSETSLGPFSDPGLEIGCGMLEGVEGPPAVAEDEANLGDVDRQRDPKSPSSPG